jgi:protein SCO1/2
MEHGRIGTVESVLRAFLWGAIGVLAFLLVIGTTFLAARMVGPTVDKLMTGTANVSPSGAPPPGPEVPAFSFSDQEGRSVSRDALRGRVWIAAFILPQCSGTCPATSAKMARLQDRIRDRRVQLVSFSMEPSRDTAALKAYAAQFHADPERWHLLTGSRTDSVRVAAAIGVASHLAQRPEDIIHSDRLVLIDVTGRARGSYAVDDDHAMDRLAINAVALAENATR